MNLLQRRAENARLQCAEIGLDVGQLRHRIQVNTVGDSKVMDRWRRRPTFPFGADNDDGPWRDCRRPASNTIGAYRFYYHRERARDIAGWRMRGGARNRDRREGRLWTIVREPKYSPR